MKIETSHSVINHPTSFQARVASFWDNTSLVWNEIWGPHIHHGYYSDEKITLSPQENLLEKLIKHLTIFPQQKWLDVGCGMGETAIYLSKHFPLHITGINLSEKQLEIARLRAKEEQLDYVVFKKEDALSLQSFHDETFDIVWSLESCEQFLDKEQFIKQCHRVLKPGGKLLLATWCSEKESYEGKMAKDYLALCQTYCVPYMPTMEYYSQRLALYFDVLFKEDWSIYIKPSWAAGLSKLSQYSYFDLLKFCRIKDLPLIWKVNLMADAFQHGHIRYGVFVAQKKPFQTNI